MKPLAYVCSKCFCWAYIQGTAMGGGVGGLVGLGGGVIIVRNFALQKCLSLYFEGVLRLNILGTYKKRSEHKDIKHKPSFTVFTLV